MIRSCEDITEGIIENSCTYQVNALDEAEMKALIKAHLKQDHISEYDNLESDKITGLEKRVTELFS